MLRFGESASSELEEAVRWYEAQVIGLGQDLRISVDETLQRILRLPEAGSPLAQVESRTLRRRLVPRFPFEIVYYIDGRDVVVVAVAHMRRRPGYWGER